MKTSVEKKYQLTDKWIQAGPNFQKVYQIVALKEWHIDGEHVKKGDLGGYVASESNLSQYGKCWIFGDSVACDNSHVGDDAILAWGAVASGNARLAGRARVRKARVGGDAAILDAAYIYNADVTGGYVFANSICGTKDAVVKIKKTSDVVFLSGLGAVVCDATVFQTSRGLWLAARGMNAPLSDAIEYIEDRIDEKIADILRAVEEYMD